MRISNRIFPIVVIMTICQQGWAWNDDLYKSMPMNAVLVDVNGEALTKNDVECEYAIWNKIEEPKRNSSRQTPRLRVHAVERFVEETLFAQYAKKAGVYVSEASVKAEILEIIHKYVDPDARFTTTFLKSLGEEASVRFKASIRRRLYAEAAKKHVEGKVPEVTDADVAKCRADWLALNEQAIPLKRRCYEMATNIWREITVKTNFDAKVEAYRVERDHVHGDPEWGTFSLSYFDDSPKLQMRLREMSVGEITPPVEADNGLMIVKLLEKIEPLADDPDKSPRYRLASLFFALPYVWEPIPDDKLKCLMSAERQEEAWNKVKADIRREATITYPSGRDWLDTRTPIKRNKRNLAK